MTQKTAIVPRYKYGTTLNAIESYGPCASGFKKLLHFLYKRRPDDHFLPFETILESNGLHDAIWCLRTIVCDHTDNLSEYLGNVVAQVAPVWRRAVYATHPDKAKLLDWVADKLKNHKRADDVNVTGRSPAYFGLESGSGAHTAWRVANYAVHAMNDADNSFPEDAGMNVDHAVSCAIGVEEFDGMEAKGSLVVLKHTELFRQFWCSPREEE